MELQKECIRAKFSRASSSYDKVAFIQRACAIRLVDMLRNYFPKFYPYAVLDLGTGTGYIPALLFDFFPHSRFTVNDISSNMLTQARKKLAKKVEYSLGDMEMLDFGFYSLVTSNLALQWVSNIEKMIEKSYANSAIFAFSSLLKGTFHEWSQIFIDASLPIPTYRYPSRQALENYLLYLKPKKYFFDVQKFTLSFANASEFIRYLKNLGANQSNQAMVTSDLRGIIKMHTHNIHITYEVFFCLLSQCKSL